MPALQVRDFPDDLYARLRESAAKNHRSIAQQTIACVESQLNQEEAQGSILAPDFSGPSGFQNARVAAAQARFVDSFDWLRDFDSEPEEAIEARRSKRQQLRLQSGKIMQKWNGPVPSTSDIAQMVRESREERSNQVANCVEEALHARRQS